MFSLFSFKALTMASVKVSQPLPLWEAGLPAATVRTLFSIKTPWLAQRVRSPEGVGVIPKSFLISLKMFWREGGRFTPSLTAKERPLAWLGPW